MNKSLLAAALLLVIPALASAAVVQQKEKAVKHKVVTKKVAGKCDAKNLALFKTGRGFGECVTNCRKHHRDIGCKRGELRGQCWRVCDKAHPIKAKRSVKARETRRPPVQSAVHQRTYGIKAGQTK